VEERAGERRFPTHPPPFMSQPWVGAKIRIGIAIGIGIKSAG
jgi:hypothetical protein